MTEWVAIVQAGGTVAVLAIFGYLFWTGEIMSKKSVDRISQAYDVQAKALSNGFLAKLEASTEKQCRSLDGLVMAIKESTSETKQSRTQMQEVIREFSTSLGEIKAHTSGATPRRAVRRKARSS